MAFKDLFRPSWKHSKWTVRRDAVPRITDHKLLAEIGRNDPHPLVRMAAVGELADEQVLAAIAKDDSNADVSLTAVRRLTKQTLLAEVAGATRHDRVVWVAVAMLDDQGLLANIARTSSAPAARMTAARKLTAQPILAEIAKTDTDGTTRKVAVELLTDFELLAEIAKKDSERSVRIAAAKKLAHGGEHAYKLAADGPRRLLAWLLEHEGRRVRWTHSAPFVSHQGEWTIEAPDVRREGEYVFSIPRDYFVEHLEAGVKYREKHTIDEWLELPPRTYSTLLVDGCKVVHRLHYKEGPGPGISPVRDESDADYLEQWSFELLEQPL